jgi:hypothetical protein
MLRALNWLRWRQRQTHACSRRRPRRPQLELLEDRAVPAGNVLAEQVGFQLTLIGDDLSNNIRVTNGSQPGEVIVQGIGTTVNGASAQTFQNVGALFAHLLDGDDTLTAENLSLRHADFQLDFVFIFIDGNGGDDRIEFINSNIQANSVVDVQIYGERAVPGFPLTPTTGNDTIRLIGSTFNAEGIGTFTAANVLIYGEHSMNGTVLEGDDTIVIQDTVIRAAGEFSFTITNVNIFGSYSSAQDGSSSIGRGNDKITLSGATIAAANGFQNIAAVSIVGDHNEAFAFGANTVGTIGVGNDVISVKDSQVTASSDDSNNTARLEIIGDRNFVGANPGLSAAATIGAGNDKIAIVNSSVAATGGGFANQAVVDLAGDVVQAFGAGTGAVSTIGGGSDQITVNASIINVDGAFQNAAGMFIDGERQLVSGAESVIGAGHDDICLRNVQLLGAPRVFEFRSIFVNFFGTDVGDDRLDVIDCLFSHLTADMGDGDDTVKLLGNTILGEASLLGGLGFDALDAHDNTGLLFWFEFEDVNVT